MAVHPDDLLRMVADEARRCIGLGQNGASQELTDDRDRAMRFFKGDVSKEIPSLPNRSSVASSDIADAVNTIKPDLIEIFIGDQEDPLTFQPTGQEDEDQAEQETDYVRHVIFQQNNGFILLNTLFDDALLQKTGVAKYWWEEGSYDDEEVECLTAEDLTAIDQDPETEILSYELDADDAVDGGIPLYSAKLRKKRGGRVMIDAVAPEDFGVSADTNYLQKATYCVQRSRPRAQDLIADGVDRELVDQLGEPTQNEETDISRDTAGEHSSNGFGSGIGDLRQVEVLEHYIRTLDGDELKLFKVVTNADRTVLIDHEEVNRIPYAAITPYMVAHRFYGLSVADLLEEIQKINSVLMRTALDSAYFALNQRMEVSDADANEFTIPDLLMNEPGVPIRSRSGSAVRPIQAGSLNFDVFSALEFFKATAEQRTGIVRNAQGLNSDALHETASGAASLMAAAQKRVRMIARVFAETGIRDLYLGVHALIREHADDHKRGVVRLRGGWSDIDPTSWGNRCDMKIEVGIGSGGRDAELLTMQAQKMLMESIVQAQGGASGPVVTMDNIYAFAKRFLSKSGSKTPELFVTDPATAQPAAPAPDPVAMEIQAKQQMQAMEIQGRQQIEQMKAQGEAQTQLAKAQTEVEIARLKAESDLTLQREKMAMEDAFRREQGQAELALKREEMDMEFRIKALTAAAGVSGSSQTVSGPEMGGEPG